MTGSKGSHSSLKYLIVAIAALLAFSLACAAGEPTATPIPTAAPIVPATPTPVPLVPTPTRALPTPTPVATGKLEYGGTLRFATNLDSIRSWDPAYSIVWGEYFEEFSFYNTLARLGVDGTIQPELAQSWAISADGKAITFQLQKGVKFHDGTDFNAQAAKWNMDRHMDQAVGSSQKSHFAAVERVDVKDDYSFTVQLKYPWRPLLAAFTERPGMMASPAAVQKWKSYAVRLGDYGRNPVGTGPFKLVDWGLGSYVTLEKNPSYWEKDKPYLDRIRYQHAVDSTIAWAMVRTGESDLMEFSGLAFSDLRIGERNPNLQIIGGPSARYYVMHLNLSKEPWNSKALRQAMAFAIDRQSLIDNFFDGRGIVAYRPYGQGWFDDPTIKPYAYDAKKAKEKLTEAGYPQGITTTLTCESTAIELQVCEALQAQAKAVGINFQIDPRLYADIWSDKLLYKGNFLAYYTWSAPRADPHVRLEPTWRGGGWANYNGYSNPEVDKLFDQGAQTYDVAKAKEVYSKLIRTVVEDIPQIFTVHPNMYVAASKKVRNYVWIPLDTIIRLRDLWLEK